MGRDWLAARVLACSAGASTVDVDLSRAVNSITTKLRTLSVRAAVAAWASIARLARSELEPFVRFLGIAPFPGSTREGLATVGVELWAKVPADAVVRDVFRRADVLSRGVDIESLVEKVVVPGQIHAAYFLACLLAQLAENNVADGFSKAGPLASLLADLLYAEAELTVVSSNVGRMKHNDQAYDLSNK